MNKVFLEKQKANQELASRIEVNTNINEKSKNKSKCNDTSDQEETQDVLCKTGTDVLKTFQSFSFWQDSNNEEDAQSEENPEKKMEKEEVGLRQF